MIGDLLRTVIPMGLVSGGTRVFEKNLFCFCADDWTRHPLAIIVPPGTGMIELFSGRPSTMFGASVHTRVARIVLFEGHLCEVYSESSWDGPVFEVIGKL